MFVPHPFRYVNALLVSAILMSCASTTRFPSEDSLGKADLIDLWAIPEALELGSVEVERRGETAIGWQCYGPTAHLYGVDRMRRGEPRYAPGASLGEMFSKSIGTQRLPVIDPVLWNEILGTYLRNRLSKYATEGKPGLGGGGRNFPWQEWLKQTLEDINKKADLADLSQEQRARVLRDWVACHVSETEAEALRNAFHKATRR